jgi:hypothetical protein
MESQLLGKFESPYVGTQTLSLKKKKRKKKRIFEPEKLISLSAS